MTHQIKHTATPSGSELRDHYRRIALALILLPVSGTVAQAQTRLASSTARQGTPPHSAVQDAREERTLEPGTPIESEMKEGAGHSYRVALTSGQYLHVSVEQRGVDVVVALRGPDGALLSEMDGQRGTSGVEELSWEAASTGWYVLEVRARAHAANAARYEVRAQKVAAATKRDLARIAAQRLFMEAIRAEAEARGAGLERAVEKYGEAVEQWRAAGDRKWEGQTLHNLGGIFHRLGRYEKAVDYYEQAVWIRREIRDRFGEGTTLNGLGNAYWSLSQYEQAKNYYGQSLILRRETKDRFGEGATRNGLGNVYVSLSQYEQAREHYEQALAIMREVKHRLAEGQALNNLGEVHRSLSQYDKALEYYQQSLAITRETKNRIGEGQTLNNLGSVYWSLSRGEKALDYYEQALAIKRETRDRFGEGITLNNLGNVYVSLSRYEKAREHFEQSLAIMREVKNREVEGNALSNLGGVYRNLGQYDKAVEYYEQSLVITREIKDKRREGETLIGLGTVYRNLRQYEKARDNFERALAIMREVKGRRGEGEALASLGIVYKNLRQYEKALGHYERALAIMREIGDASGEAETLISLAALERDRGDLPEALRWSESALSVIENLRTTYTNQELRSVYFSTVQDHYEFYIDLLMRLHKQHPSAGHDAAALRASERSRARALLDLLAEAGADIRQGVDPRLVESERSMQRQLNLKAQLQLKLLSGPHTKERASAVAREIEELTAEYQKLRTRIRQSSPRYATLTQPASLGLKEIQQLLDPDTLLLEYALGEYRSYLWAVSRTAVASYELPNRAEIERAARRVYESLSASNATADSGYAEAADSLSRMLLGPAAAQLGKKRLVVVSDGYLQYLPFAALPKPRVDGSVSRGSNSKRARRPTSTGLASPLIVEHEIVSLPSASLLAVLRREMKGRAPAPNMIAALADPVFDRADLRVKPEAGKQTSEESNRVNEPQDAKRSLPLQLPPDLERSARDVGGLSFERLRSTRDEAEEIVSLAHGGGNLKALDFEASRATALSEGLGQYRIVHFATHGLLNSQHPELSGLVLSLVDERGRPQDGFLRAHEVYNLKLGADLVVLSACQTALGKEVRGEGLVGMTRGFMYAGSPRVVASLWRVPSRATAELMKRFYRGMLVEGLRPAAALRAAQIGMLKEKRWSEPYYWAAFVLQGEWQ